MAACGPPGQSIKTRVEALAPQYPRSPGSRPPGQSIKTRVEAVRIPSRRPRRTVRLDNPLKQGLKLRHVAPGRVFRLVRLDNPLKQGLKLGGGAMSARKPRKVRLDNPLKQGLKPLCATLAAPRQYCPPGQSIKTRVEALRGWKTTNIARCPPGQSIKTRVEARQRRLWLWPLRVRLDNPLKQGLKLGGVVAGLAAQASAWTIH